MALPSLRLWCTLTTILFVQECTSYHDGDYIGDESADGLRSGHGECRFTDGGVYVGSWDDDERCGAGTMWFPDQSRYNGNWSRGRFNGQGTWERGDQNGGMKRLVDNFET